ncbi:MAG: OmpA family protein [Bacteroidales bacterium]
MRFRTLVVSMIVSFFLLGCSAQYYMNHGDKAYKRGLYEKATHKYRKAGKKKVSNSRSEVYLKLAECYRKYGRYDNSRAWYKNTIGRNHGGLDALLHYADMLKTNDNYEDAKELYATVLSQEENNRLAKNGFQACSNIESWTSATHPYVVENLKEVNSYANDFCSQYLGNKEAEIIFSSNRRGTTGKSKSAVTGELHYDIFYSRFNREELAWESPRVLEANGVIDTDDDEGAVSVSSDGSVIYFTRCQYDKQTDISSAIYVTNQTRGNYSDPQRVKLDADSLVVAHPALSPDGNTLYFVSDRRGGYGGNDIWKSMKADGGGEWGAPINMGAGINTPGNEMFPYVDPQGTLYFSSDGQPSMGGLDVFRVDKDINNVEEIVNMGVPFNSSGDDFGIVFFDKSLEQGMFTSNREGSRNDDIYSFMIPPIKQELFGRVLDDGTSSQMDGATVRLIGTDGTNLKISAVKGEFNTLLKPEVRYVVAAYKDGYLNAKDTFSTMGVEESKLFHVDLSLTPTRDPIKLDNIYFEFGKWELLPESRGALDSLVTLLKTNPSITIELMAHTDHIGSSTSNSQLSQKRAQSVVNYLISEGNVNSQRLIAKGYGETWPKTVNKEIAKEYSYLKEGQILSEAFIESLLKEQQEVARMLNRRIEFRVLSNDFDD